MPDVTRTHSEPVPAPDDPRHPASPEEGSARPDPLAARVRAATPGLRPLVARATAARRARERLTGADAAKARGAPRWTDVFTTQFTEFSNRPR